MNDEARLGDLLSQWQRHWEQGQDISAAQLCADCPELVPEMERRIEALRQMDRPTRALPTTVSYAPADSEPGTAAPAGTFPIIPGYEVLGELGRGGMGVVYKARHLRLNRLVALKMILTAECAGEQELKRFHLEAEALARLSHPNIVQIHEVGEVGGKPFFSLEFVDGGSLAARLGGTPLPARQAAMIVETLARAVEAAHEGGVVHRDLKPANVLLPAGKFEPKITDFGLAKRVDTASGQTKSGAILGTPSYMAPEQARGEIKKIGRKADVYALGAILYECLTGRPPFRAATVMDTLMQVVSDEPVPPSRLQPKLPRDLETICLKCLEKAQGKRYASAEALAEDLRRFQAGEAIVARPVGGVERALKWARRRPAAAALVGVSVAAALLLAAVAVVMTVNAEQQRALKKKAEDAAEATKKALEENLRASQLRERTSQVAVYGRVLNEALQAWRENDIVHAQERLNSLDSGLRGWEWYHLWLLTTRKCLPLQGHNGPVLSACFSPDGKRLASGSGDQTVKVWDAATGQEVLSLKGHTNRVNSVCFSPDGERLASGSETVKVWDAATGQEVLSLQGHTGPVTSVCFSPDGKRLASGSGGWDAKNQQNVAGEVKVWDAATGQEILSLKGHTAAVSSVCFSPDRERLASGSEMVKLWDAATGQEVISLKGHTGGVTSVCFSPDGKRLASGCHDQTVKVWDAATSQGQEVLSLKGHTQWVTSVCFSPDGKRLASGSHDQTVKVWDTATGLEVLNLQGHTGPVTSVCFSPDGKRLASASGGYRHDVAREVKVWDAATGQEVLSLKGHTASVDSVCFSPDGKRLASASRDQTVKLWDVTTDELRPALKGQK